MKRYKGRQREQRYKIEPKVLRDQGVSILLQILRLCHNRI